MEKQEIFILYRWNQISPDIFFINDPSIDLDKCVEKTVCRLLREEPLVYFYKIIILKYRWNVEKGRKKEGRKEGRKESFLLDDREDIEIDRWSKLAIFQGCTIAKPWPSPELSSRKGHKCDKRLPVIYTYLAFDHAFLIEFAPRTE